MKLDEYQQHVLRTTPRSLDAYPAVVRFAYETLYEQGDQSGEFRAAEDLLKLQDIHIWAHGLAGEAGEVCDLLKKTHGHGKPYDADKMLKELGDVMWYVAALAHAHGFTLAQVAEANVAKLLARYPAGFSVAAAAAKADEAPVVEVKSSPERKYPRHPKEGDKIREHFSTRLLTVSFVSDFGFVRCLETGLESIYNYDIVSEPPATCSVCTRLLLSDSSIERGTCAQCVFLELTRPAPLPAPRTQHFEQLDGERDCRGRPVDDIEEVLK